MANFHAVPQTGMDEQVIKDEVLEEALETRLRAHLRMATVRSEVKQIDEETAGLITRLELPEEGAVRVGRFRLTRKKVSAHSVSFDVGDKYPVRIALIPEGE